MTGSVSRHRDVLLHYLNEKVVITECAGKRFKNVHNTKDFTSSTICSSYGYPVSRFARGYTARFAAARAVQGSG